MQSTQLDLTADVIDVRDIIARVEELAEELTTYTATAAAHPELAAEHAALCAILRELKGYSGDEQWDGDWYPITLICDSHFTDYAIELLEDCGDLPRNLPHYIAIDWEATARNIRVDYTAIEIDGQTYWYR
jgi:hypothetical protein